MNLQAWVAEFIGTFALIFVGVGAIVADHASHGESGLVGVALAHGLTIAVMVTATAAVSGGHLNPAVTIGLLSVRKIEPANAAGYVAAQCLGAIVAAAALRGLLPDGMLADVRMGTPVLSSGTTELEGTLLEMILTFFLAFVVFGTAIDARAPKLGGLCIGLTVALDILIGGPFTGAAMNPARHLGPALLGGGLGQTWLYWLGPVAGGVLAAQVYHHVLQKAR